MNRLLSLVAFALLALPITAHAAPGTRRDPAPAATAPASSTNAGDLRLPAPPAAVVVQPLPLENPFGFNNGMFGLNFGIPSGGAPTIGFSYFLAPRAALEVNVGLGFTFTGNTDYAFSIELGYRNYFARVGQRLFPFFQPGFFFNRAGGAEEIAIEGLIGVEYFLLERFTISGATGVAFQIGNIGGTGDAAVRLATGTTALYANFYF